MRTIIMLLLCFSLIGCKSLGSGFAWMYGLPYDTPKNAPPEWKLGWEHGCKSGYSAYGADFHKSIYSFTQDVKMIQNADYSKAWTDGFNYCRAFINRYLAGESFSNVPDGEYSKIFSTRNFNLKGFNLRNEKDVVSKGLGLGIFDGVDPPGWGEWKWGGDVSCEHDWLGRMPKGCGWMGYDWGQ